MSKLIFLSVLLLFSNSSFGSFSACKDLLKSGSQHKIITEKQALNETDKALWIASEYGSREVGVIELLNSEGEVLDATDFEYQTHEGEIVRRNIHIPFTDPFKNLLRRMRRYPQAVSVRCTHVHPKIWRSGILVLGPIWLFSSGDKQAAYVMKLMLERAGLTNLAIEMHLVYQMPFATRPTKKLYKIESHYTWADGSYSIGKENDQRLRSALSGQ